MFARLFKPVSQQPAPIFPIKLPESTYEIALKSLLAIEEAHSLKGLQDLIEYIKLFHLNCVVENQNGDEKRYFEKLLTDVLWTTQLFLANNPKCTIDIYRAFAMTVQGAPSQQERGIGYGLMASGAACFLFVMIQAAFVPQAVIPLVLFGLLVLGIALVLWGYDKITPSGLCGRLLIVAQSKLAADNAKSIKKPAENAEQPELSASL